MPKIAFFNELDIVAFKSTVLTGKIEELLTHCLILTLKKLYRIVA